MLRQIILQRTARYVPLYRQRIGRPHSLSHHITSHHITSHHITPHHTTPHHTTPHHTTPHHTTPHHTTPHHTTPHHTTPHHTTPHHTTPHHTTPHHTTPHTPCHRRTTARHSLDRRVHCCRARLFLVQTSRGDAFRCSDVSAVSSASLTVAGGNNATTVHFRESPRPIPHSAPQPRPRDSRLSRAGDQPSLGHVTTAARGNITIATTRAYV